MTDYKDVSEVTEGVLSQIYRQQTQDNRLRVLLALYMLLDEEEQDAFLRLATDTAKSKDKYYLWQLKNRLNRK